MNLIERIYPGEVPRPTPIVVMEPAEDLLVVATPWGGRAEVERALKSLVSSYAISRSDQEATSPFARLPGLKSAANNLRMSARIANEMIHRSCNDSEYAQACEVLLLARTGREVTWLQVGQPHLLVLRRGQLSALGAASDLSLDFGMRAPLPGKLLGTEREVDLETRSFAIQEGDLLVLLARAAIPPAVFTRGFEGVSAEKAAQSIFERIVESDPAQPFWMGILQPR